MQVLVKTVQVRDVGRYISETADREGGLQQQFEVRVFAGSIGDTSAKSLWRTIPSHSFHANLSKQRPDHDAATRGAQFDSVVEIGMPKSSKSVRRSAMASW